MQQRLDEQQKRLQSEREKRRFRWLSVALAATAPRRRAHWQSSRTSSSAKPSSNVAWHSPASMAGQAGAARRPAAPAGDTARVWRASAPPATRDPIPPSALVTALARATHPSRQLIGHTRPSSGWRSAPTAPARHRQRRPRRYGCGTPPPANPTASPSPATPTSSARWRSAPTAGCSPAPAATRRCGCGTPRPASPTGRPLTRPHRRRHERGVQPRRHTARQRQRRPDACGCGTSRPANRTASRSPATRTRSTAWRSAPTAQLLASASADQHGAAVGRRDRPTPRPAAHRPHRHASTRVAFSPDGTLLASGQRRQHGAAVGRRDRPAARRTRSRGHTGAVTAWRSAPTGELLATASDDHTVRLWDAATGQPHGQPLNGHTELGHRRGVQPRRHDCWPPPAPTGRVRLWDAAPRPLRQPAAHRPHRRRHRRGVQPRRHAAGQRQRRPARCGCGTSTTGQPHGQPLTGHTDAVIGVAFSPDGHAARHRRRATRRCGCGTPRPASRTASP